MGHLKWHSRFTGPIQDAIRIARGKKPDIRYDLGTPHGRRAIKAVVSAIKKHGFASSRKNNAARVAAIKVVLIDRKLYTPKRMKEIIEINKRIKEREGQLFEYLGDRRNIQKAMDEDAFMRSLWGELKTALGGKLALSTYYRAISHAQTLIEYNSAVDAEKGVKLPQN